MQLPTILRRARQQLSTKQNLINISMNVERTRWKMGISRDDIPTLVMGCWSVISQRLSCEMRRVRKAIKTLRYMIYSVCVEWVR